MNSFYLVDQDDKTKASPNPTIVMVDEQTGEKFARATGRKGRGDDGDMDWFVSDMEEELRVWGHSGEASCKTVRDAVARPGGITSLEQAAGGETNSNGPIEEAGKTVRESVRVFREQLEEKT